MDLFRPDYSTDHMKSMLDYDFILKPAHYRATCVWNKDGQNVPDASGNVQRVSLISYHYEFGASTRTKS
jgi:hypothetical protein